MKLSSYIIASALRQLQLPKETLDQFELVNELGNVADIGFPKELLQLSAPVIIRGLANFSIFQMNREWVYPYWVNQQLDPASESFVARSQNPLLINITHRNWTLLGSPNGKHEAIVDPRGLATPLPREWSIDLWLAANGTVGFPSTMKNVSQVFDTKAPRLTTSFSQNGLVVEQEHFVGSTNHDIDIFFGCVKIENTLAELSSGAIFIAIRPFNPEGIAPIHSIEFKSERMAYVNDMLGIVFAERPDWVHVSNKANGDSAAFVRSLAEAKVEHPLRGGISKTQIRCTHGMANGIAAFDFHLEGHQQKVIHYSVALESDGALKTRLPKKTWRVSFDKRKKSHEDRWRAEIQAGGQFRVADEEIQKLFDASRLTLLQLHDGDFISPGPFLYHHFWFRDSVPMARALDQLGYSKRARQIIDAFPARMTSDGFFKGPDGEWDSNGSVIWSVYQHYLLTRSELWLRGWYPRLAKASRWISRMRKKTANKPALEKGLMPEGISAEHLGTVDQYFWDSFWSLSGLVAFAKISELINRQRRPQLLLNEIKDFEQTLVTLFAEIESRLGEALIPSAPGRPFDESAIGSICCIYPLELFNGDVPSAMNTVKRLSEKYVDEKGFLHPFIHSGYNPYLTLHLAHCFLQYNDFERAWKIAQSVFRQAGTTYSLPEAIHPRTGGGVMGDGHHGWAAAEIVLFIRECLIREKEDELFLFEGGVHKLIKKGINAEVQNIPTIFGKISCSLRFESSTRAILEFSGKFFSEHPPRAIHFCLPFEAKKIKPVSPHYVQDVRIEQGITRVTCLPDFNWILFEL
jgi:hypothetical protein